MTKKQSTTVEIYLLILLAIFFLLKSIWMLCKYLAINYTESDLLPEEGQ